MRTIEEVEVEHETKHFVKLVGRNFKEAKDSGYLTYHDTWEAAHQHLIQQEQARVASAKVSLASAERDLATIKALTR